MSEEHGYGVDWAPRFGAICPKCERYTKESYKDLGWRDTNELAGFSAVKLRYHRCPSCGHNFQSRQYQQEVPEPEPWQLVNLRDYNGRRGGVFVGGGEWLGLPM